MPQNWQRAKNALVKQRADAFVETRFNELDMRARAHEVRLETVDEYLRRGGRINRIDTGRIIIMETATTPRTEVICQASAPTKMEKMKAVDAAKMAIDDPTLTISVVLGMIPQYAAPLPRRSWIAKFKSSLPDKNDPRFIDLV